MTTPLDHKTLSRLKHARAAMRLCTPDELTGYALIAARAVLTLFPHGEIEGSRTQHVIETVWTYTFTDEDRADHGDAIKSGFDAANKALQNTYQPA